jgi:curved DNA-binding protein CbpA
MMQDPYRVLGVSPQVTDDEVKKAYRALAKNITPM